jgi:RND family efflux transporter MFP subunit
MTRKIGLPLLVLAVATIGAFVLDATAPSVQSASPERALIAVRVVDAKPQTLRLTVHSEGTVAPRSETELVPEVSGPVVWVSPSLVSGGFFEAGEPMLRIESLDYEGAVARSRAALARAKGEAEHTSAELKRQQELSSRNVASSSQLSNARRAATVSQAAVDEARVSLEQAERDLVRTVIRSPFEGRVRNEHVDLGQFVSRGQSVAMLYATDFAEIRLPIADTQLAYLDLPSFRRDDERVGPLVTLRANFAGAERSWSGRIVRTEGEIDPKSRMVHVVARVSDPYNSADDNGDNKNDSSEGHSAEKVPLSVGLFVRAEIEGRVEPDVIVVPRVAMRNDERIVVVDGEDRLHFRAVEVLRIERDDVLVRVRLGPGERICISPLQVVVDGMRVQPIDDAAKRAPRA